MSPFLVLLVDDILRAAEEAEKTRNQAKKRVDPQSLSPPPWLWNLSLGPGLGSAPALGLRGSAHGRACPGATLSRPTDLQAWTRVRERSDESTTAHGRVECVKVRSL